MGGVGRSKRGTGNKPKSKHHKKEMFLPVFYEALS